MEFVLATSEDVSEIKKTMSEIHDQMEEKNWFFEDEEPVIREYIESKGFGIKAMKDGVMAGFFIVYYPEERDDNLGKYMQFGKEDLLKVAHMEIAMVKPEYRGLGIQGKLMELCEERIRQTSYTHLMATVHPDNIYSAGNMKKLGYKVVAEDLKYGGLSRLIFYKKLEK